MSLLRGDAIRTRRRSLGMSQRRLGALSGLNGTTVHRIETEEGSGKYLRLNQLDNLARALAVDPAWLLTDPDDTHLAPSAADADGAIGSDAGCVGALLIGQPATSLQTLAISLGWDLARLHRALTDLQRRLPTVGGVLRSVEGAVQILSNTSQALGPPRQRISRLRLGTRPLNREELRMFNRLRAVNIRPIALDWVLRQPVVRRLVDADLLREPATAGGAPDLGPDVYTTERVLTEHGIRTQDGPAEIPLHSPRPENPLRTGRALAIPVQAVAVPAPTETNWTAVRQWARDNGYTVGNRGGIRVDIIDAYYRARTGASPSTVTEAMSRSLDEPTHGE